MTRSVGKRGLGRLFGLLTAAVLFAPIGVSSAQEKGPGAFYVQTTKDLITLCSADPGDDNYVAAIHFCHGFTSGAYRYYEAVAKAAPAHRYVCLPDPSPTRDQAIAAFVVWANAHPETLSVPPVESIFRFLGETYPCR